MLLPRFTQDSWHFLPQVNDKWQVCDIIEVTASREGSIVNRIGPVIKSLREKAGLSQAELAQMAGLQQSLISRYETGSRERVDTTMLAPIAKALGVTVDEINLRAGLPTLPIVEKTALMRRLERVVNQLSPARQEELIAIAIALGTMPEPTIRPADVLEKGEPTENAPSTADN